MTCTSPSSALLEFASSGVKVRPTKLTYSEDGSEFAFSSVTVTAAAGDHIVDNAEFPEPVILSVGGKRLRRMFVPKEGVSIGNRTASVRVLDVRRMLLADNVNYVNDDLTLGEAIAWFRGRVINDDWAATDPHGVLTDVQPSKALSPTDLGEKSVSHWGQIGMYTDTAWVDSIDQLAREIGIGLLQAVDSRIDILDENGGLFIEDVNLEGTLQIIEDTWAVDSWVDHDGVLRIGPRSTDSDLYEAGEGKNRWNLRTYDIVRNPYPVEAAWVRGGYYRGNPEASVDPTNQSVGTRLWGYATFGEDWDDAMNQQATGGKVVTAQVDTQDRGVLKRQAKRRLLSEVSGTQSGSLTVNPIGSPTSHGDPRDIGVGDNIVVFPGDDDLRCNKALERPTMFAVTRVEHEVKGSDGWTLKIGVSSVPLEPVFTAVVESRFGDLPYTSDVDYAETVDLTAKGKPAERSVGPGLWDFFEKIYDKTQPIERASEDEWTGGEFIK